ncbi:MAG TPA: hypothetical protein VGI39_42630, partial [Polyangiaceae bacterium]
MVSAVTIPRTMGRTIRGVGRKPLVTFATSVDTRAERERSDSRELHEALKARIPIASSSRAALACSYRRLRTVSPVAPGVTNASTNEARPEAAEDRHSR